MLTIDRMCEIVGCKEYSYLGDEIFAVLFDKTKREKMFLEFLSEQWDLSKDWFTSYFEQHIADRKNYKQDYTPHAVSAILAQIVGGGQRTFEATAGTGGIIITKWHADRCTVHPLKYRPSNYFYHTEELSQKNIPFLLFNFMIRGMNAIVIHGDSLSRITEQVYFASNDADNPIGFSSLNVMPRTKDCETYFDIRGWEREPIYHVESPCLMSQ